MSTVVNWGKTKTTLLHFWRLTFCLVLLPDESYARLRVYHVLSTVVGGRVAGKPWDEFPERKKKKEFLPFTPI